MSVRDDIYGAETTCRNTHPRIVRDGERAAEVGAPRGNNPHTNYWLRAAWFFGWDAGAALREARDV